MEREGGEVPQIPRVPEWCQRQFRPSRLAIGPYYVDDIYRLDIMSMQQVLVKKFNAVNFIVSWRGKPFGEWGRVLEQMKDELYAAYHMTTFVERNIHALVPHSLQRAVQDVLPVSWRARMHEVYETAVHATAGGLYIDYNKTVHLWFTVYDGCFLLEIMLESHERAPSTVALFDPTEMEDYRHDMLLVDNQIPLKVLLSLVSIRFPDGQHDSFKFVIDHILRFFSLPQVSISESDGCLHILDVYRHALLGSTQNASESKQTGNKDVGGSERTNSKAQCFHILDVYQHCLYGAKDADGSKQTDSKVLDFYIPSATELQEARIGITTSDTSFLMDISFTDDKTLRLPQIRVDKSIKWNFDNVILLEQFHPRANKSLSSYICFMKRLLKSGRDCSLLQSRGVIITLLPDDEVVQLFQGLRESIEHYPNMMMETELQKVGQNLINRYNKNMEPWLKDLFEIYLKSPWAVIATIAAFLIFSLTIIQTIYSVLSFYKGK